LENSFQYIENDTLAGFSQTNFVIALFAMYKLTLKLEFKKIIKSAILYPKYITFIVKYLVY